MSRAIIVTLESLEHLIIRNGHGSTGKLPFWVKANDHNRSQQHQNRHDQLEQRADKFIATDDTMDTEGSDESW